MLAVVNGRNPSCDMTLLAMNLFYFNQRDLEEGTIHEGFIGVRSSVRGRGIARSLRHYCAEHFRRSGLVGVSTRISVSNAASLKSATRVGFTPVEKYTDPTSDEERYYMVNRFEAPGG